MALLRRKDNPEARMSLAEHFREFRNRATIALIAIVLVAIYAFVKFDPIWDWFVEPMKAVANERQNGSVAPNFGQGITSAFETKLKISLWVGLIFASPVWLWQIWAFLAPGLTTKEKRISLSFILTAIPLFFLGCWIATIVLPNAVKFLLGVTPADAVNFQDAPAYISFVTKFVLVFGFAFLLPVFLVALNAIGVLPANVMIKGWRVAVMLIFIFAAVMSPSPDAWSMLALALPMVALFYVAVGIGWILDKRRRKQRPEWMDVADDQASAL